MKFFWLAYASSLVNLFCCHVTYAFQSESTLYSCLNVKVYLENILLRKLTNEQTLSSEGIIFEDEVFKCLIYEILQITWK